MDLMKNHLKEYISSDFNPTLPQQISTLSKLIPKSKSDEEEREV